MGRNVSYDLLIPAEMRLGFPDLVAHCRQAGFDGVNVTYPHKEQALALVPPGDPVVGAMGAANTLRFGAQGAQAFNTDCTGFVAARRARFGTAAPGRVLVIGAGGLGRAVAFGLAALGAAGIELFDTDLAKVVALAGALRGHAPGIPVSAAAPDRLADLTGLDGVVNGTPLGMVRRPGSPLPAAVTGRPAWAFDAVYTPEDTAFRAQALALGADFLSGYELYFHQGVQAFEIFAGQRVDDVAWVRATLNHRGRG